MILPHGNRYGGAFVALAAGAIAALMAIALVYDIEVVFPKG